MYFPQKYGMKKTFVILIWNCSSRICTYRHGSKIKFLATISHRHCDIFYLFLKLKSRHMNLLSFYCIPFCPWIYETNRAQDVEDSTVAIFKIEATYVGTITSFVWCLWSCILILKESEEGMCLDLFWEKLEYSKQNNSQKAILQ